MLAINDLHNRTFYVAPDARIPPGCLVLRDAVTCRPVAVLHAIALDFDAATRIASAEEMRQTDAPPQDA